MEYRTSENVKTATILLAYKTFENVKTFLCSLSIDITEVNFSNKLLWVIEDQPHQKRVMKIKRLGTAILGR